MASNNRESGYFFAKRKSRVNRNRLVAILGCMVVLATAIALMVPALSMTHGDVTCGMEEHEHTDACYEQVLVCGQDESDGHEHTDACYEVQLTCDKPEHEHSSACFASAGDGDGEDGDTNDAAENGDATESGVAGAVDATDAATAAAKDGSKVAASAASADAADDSTSQSNSASSETKDGATAAKLDTQSANMPAQEFKADLKDEDDNVVLAVEVKAPKGAFPENTLMTINGVPAEDVQERIESTLSDAGLDNPELKQAQAVDIAFFNESGDTVQPAKKVEVKIAAQSLQDVESPVLMRVLESDQIVKLADGTVTDRDGESFANSADRYEGASIVKKVEHLDSGAKDAVDGMATLAFKADEFSPYALVELDEASASQVAKLVASEDEESSDSSDGEDEAASAKSAGGTGKVIKSDTSMPAQKFNEDVKGENGKTVLSVAVEAPEGALPDGSSMVVELVEDNDVTAAAKEKAEGESAVSGSRAQVVAADITFLDAEDNAVEPAKDVRVTMGAPVVASSNELAVVHVNDKLDAEVVKASEVDQKNETVAFDAGSFSVYAIVYTVGSEFSANGELYEVTVTYGEDAKIPEGSTLKVTEFSEDDAEYEYARNSVLADKKAKGEKVDLKSFGLAALDISILNSDGEEIEPAAPVQVDIRIKELPGVENLSEVANTLAIQHHVEVKDGVVVETVFDGAAEASFELETDEAVAKKGDAVDPESVSEEDFEDKESFDDGVNVSFETDKFSTFTVTWRPWGAWSDSRTTVHYGYMDGNTFKEFDNQPSPVNITPYNRAYLIYDFENYQYSGYTYYRTNASSTPSAGGTRIQALLRYNGGWQCRGYSTNTNGRWSDINDGSHIYVVYEPATAIPQGGTPVAKQAGDTQPPEEPSISKGSTDNYDGTRTLSLSVTGHTAELEVEKLADVIVVFDTSGSMNEDMAGNDTYYDNRRRLTIAKNAVNAMARTLLSKTNSSGDKLIRMSLISFNDYATVNQGFTDDYSTFSRAVNGLSAQNGTNWEHALKLANQMAVDSERATFVITFLEKS